jgi:phosphotransferase system HPr (HPr) family protein
MTEESATVSRALHARPASQISRTAAQFSADVQLLANGGTANAKSVLSVMALDVDEGAELIVRAHGDDEDQAVDAVRRLLEGRGDSDG